jgi:hypothetical protein
MGIIYSKCYNGVIMVGGFADDSVKLWKSELQISKGVSLCCCCYSFQCSSCLNQILLAPAVTLKSHSSLPSPSEGF